MKTVILILVMVVSLFANQHTSKRAQYMKELNSLTMNQKEVLVQSLFTGIKSDKSYTLAAIAWKESSLGKHRINMHDGVGCKYRGSFGCYQQRLSYIMKDPSMKNRSAAMVKTMLVNNTNFAATVALNNLNNWEDHWKDKKSRNTELNMLASYNAGGYGTHSKSGRAYAKDVKLRMDVMKVWLSQASPNISATIAMQEHANHFKNIA